MIGHAPLFPPAWPDATGQDLDRWSSDWKGQYMIFARHDIDIAAYPAIEKHLASFRTALEPKPEDWVKTRAQPEWPGRNGGSYKWYEIQDNTAYFAEFLQPKILYQEIQYHPSYSLDRSGLLTNNKCCFILSDDPWLLAVLNSPLMWWYNWRYLGHAKDEALTPQGFQMDLLPIARCDGTNPAAYAAVTALREIQTETHEVRRLLFDWYRGSLGIVRITNLLRDPFDLDADGFVAAIQRARPARLGALNATAVRQVRAEHTNIIVPAARRLFEARKHEGTLSDLVNEAYGLTQDDVDLMWRTAPARMPIAGPPGAVNPPAVMDADAEFVQEPSE